MSMDHTPPEASEGSPFEGFDTEFEHVSPVDLDADFEAPTNRMDAVADLDLETEDIYGAGEPVSNPVDLLGDFDPYSPSAPEMEADSSSTHKETSKPETISSAETPASECKESGGCCLSSVDPRVIDLIYWRDVKKTAPVFGAILGVLFSLSYCSIISVLSYISLAVLAVTLSFVVYKKILQAIQKSGDAHPFNDYLEMDVSVPAERGHELGDMIVKEVNCTVGSLRRLFLVADIVDTIKFGLMMWILTYVGSMFNGLTLIIFAVIALFTLPKVYEVYQEPIDNGIGAAKAQINKVTETVTAKLPFLKKKDKEQ